jgi:DNA-binding transcriptional LysR family regulator
MELRHLRYFVAVSEELNFTRAAEKLRLTQPSITRQIRDLEEEIGVRMFDRSKNRISLTTEGTLFLADARIILSEFARSIRSIQRRARGEPEELHLAYTAILFHEIVHFYLKAFRKADDQTVVNLTDMKPAEQCKAIEDYRADLGFMVSRPDIHVQSLAYMCVAHEPIIMALPVRHVLARKSKVELKHLRSTPLVVLSETEYPGTRRWIMDICHTAGFTPIIHQQADSEPTVLTLVAAGVGIALLPRPVEKIPHRGVTFRPLLPPLTTKFYVAWRADNRSDALKRYLQVLSANLNALD